MQKVAILQHAEGEWIGSMDAWFADKAYELTTYRLDKGESLPTLDTYDWLLIMGGPMSVYDEETYAWLAPEKKLILDSIEAGRKVLGICLGGQLIASAMGAKVYRNEQQEIGWYPVNKTDPSAEWMPESLTPLSWHGDCFEVPINTIPFASSIVTPYQGFHLDQRVWALQFHLEAQDGTVESFFSVENSELPEGEYVQSKTDLFDDDVYLEQSREAIFALLDQLEAVR
ncbi:hypothetical protein LCGC14_1006690 [marine sediment metagenome]|uniref:Glutamine amidotransferase domain-containing protein n=1 Tax=marine sediment metagenome TaxID=412755 RepID=A0A0F9N1L4_9ZZZZ|nr:type 1 glutamine amidotransferase [Methylophaga aminisulfidivorans]